MKKDIVSLVFFLVLIAITGCATGGRNERENLLNHYRAKKFDEGLKLLNESKYFTDKNEQLLTSYEKGLFLLEAGKWNEAEKNFESAKNLAQDLYTVSISKKTEKALLNDNYDIFYGEIYENSMAYFYAALSNLELYNHQNDRQYLFKARANIVGWDSYLASIRENRLGQSVYKNDLLLKIFGAKIHELVGTREDLEVAQHLYVDAEDVLFKNYNTYQSFNLKSNDFKKDYDKLPQLSLDEVKKKYVDETSFQKTLKVFLKENKERLLKKRYKNIITLLIDEGIIAEKIPEKVHFELSGLSKDPYLSMYLASILGMTPRHPYDVGGAVAGAATASAAMKVFTFGFELPKLAPHAPLKESTINILNVDKKIIQSHSLILLNPMNDIAEEAVVETSHSLYPRIGARLMAKHVAAIMASVGTYKALGGNPKGENVWAKNAAVIQYAAASRLIEESEKADTRYWSTLPRSISMVDFELPEGEYDVELDKGQTDKSVIGHFVVEKDQRVKIIHLRK